MEIKKVIKDIPNFKWITVKLKPFLGSVILIIIIDSLTSLASVAIAIVSKNIIDYATKNSLGIAAQYAAMFAGIILFRMLASAFLSVYSTNVQERFSNSLRQSIFSKLINMEWLQVSKYHSGDLLTRLTSDIGTVSGGSISILSQIISLGVQLAAAFIALMYYDLRLAVFAFALAPVTVVFSRFYGKRIKKYHLKMQETESKYRSHIQENLQNLLVLKTFNMEEHSMDKVRELQDERLHWVTERSKTGAAANTLLSLGYWTGYFLAFGWGAIKLANKTTTFGTMTAFLQLVNQIQSPFIGLTRTLPQIIGSLASAGRLIELENLNAEEKGIEVEVPDSAGIRFKTVCFDYNDDTGNDNDNGNSDSENGSKGMLLDNISMDVFPGDIIALVGTSGEGKTTIIRLLLALLKPTEGEILCFDPKDNEYKISSATRKWFTYVPQGNTLFSGTIEESLRSGAAEASTEEIEEALRAACAMDFVEKLPDGIKTQIGEKAYGLSEGQAQRIAIARALLRKAPIIILDEATSALDISLEERIIQELRNLKPVRTCIMITHRRTSLGICNRVYKLKEGKLIIEQGGYK